MKLGSLKEGGRDGTLIVVSRDLTRAVRATGIAPTLQRALEDWSNVAPRLNALSQSLDAGDADGVLMLTPFAADNQDTAVQNLVKKYQEKYNATPDQFAADGYDAVYTVVAALKQANLTSEDKDNFNSRIFAAMTKIEVKGVTGTMTWTDDGESSKAAIAMEYRNGKAVLFTPDKE